jgi:DDE family transposase
MAAWAVTSGVSIPRSSGRRERSPVRKKNPGRSRVLAGPKAAQLKEPSDHALGYSRGGFSTKIHLLCDSHGILLGIYVTPGQRHDSKVFEIVVERVLLPHHRGQRFWPDRMAGDKGYSYECH